jgi:uncharacterized membrane protein YphA (DoxX/SURF4 family)
MTLSLFPSLLAWGGLAPFLIRLALGAVFIVWSYAGIKNRSAGSADKIISIVEGVAGLLLVIGLWTQGVALFTVIDLLVRIAGKIKNRQFLTAGVNYYLVVIVLALSLLFTGAGMFSIDLPL